MKRFLTTVSFCSLLLLAMLYFLSPASEASNNVLADLLSLPAPPPPNPLLKAQTTGRPDEFYDEDDPPADDAPIEDLLDYWKRQAGSHQRFGYNAKPLEESINKLLKAIDDDPESLLDLIDAFATNEKIAERI